MFLLNFFFYNHINLVKQKYTYTSLKSFFLLKKLLSTIFTAITITVFNRFVASSTFFTFPQWMEVTAWLEFSTWIKKTHKLHMVSQAPLIKSPLVPIALISPGLLLSVTRPKSLQKTLQKTLCPLCELSSQRLFPNRGAEVSDRAIVRGWWWWPCCL